MELSRAAYIKYIKDKYPDLDEEDFFEEASSCWHGYYYLKDFYESNGYILKQRDIYTQENKLTELILQEKECYLVTWEGNECHYAGFFIMKDTLYLYSSYGGYRLLERKTYKVNEWIELLKRAVENDEVAYSQVFDLPYEKENPKFINLIIETYHKLDNL